MRDERKFKEQRTDMMRKGLIIAFISLLVGLGTVSAQTLVIYYSFTNHCREITTSLRQQITADVLEIEPATEGIDYAADNYNVGKELILAIRENPNNASSYPEINPVNVRLAKYKRIIIVTPLWWNNMAAIMQTFLFNYGSQMAGKEIGLIVSSHSSVIDPVVEDAHRLIPDGRFYSQSLWINNSNHARRDMLITDWLQVINRESGIRTYNKQRPTAKGIYNLNGQQLPQVPDHGIYIENGVKKVRMKN